MSIRTDVIIAYLTAGSLLLLLLVCLLFVYFLFATIYYGE